VCFNGNVIKKCNNKNLNLCHTHTYTHTHTHTLSDPDNLYKVHCDAEINNLFTEQLICILNETLHKSF